MHVLHVKNINFARKSLLRLQSNSGNYGSLGTGLGLLVLKEGDQGPIDGRSRGIRGGVESIPETGNHQLSAD